MPERISRNEYSIRSGIVKSRPEADDRTNGIAEPRMSAAMRKDARGSQPAHGKKCVKTVDTITAPLPRVSART